MKWYANLINMPCRRLLKNHAANLCIRMEHIQLWHYQGFLKGMYHTPVLERPGMSSSRQILNTTIAIPSFSRDSPSITVPNCLEVPPKRNKINYTVTTFTATTPKSFKRATTATGSVALKIAPNITAVTHDQL